MGRGAGEEWSTVEIEGGRSAVGVSCVRSRGEGRGGGLKMASGQF